MTVTWSDPVLATTHEEPDPGSGAGSITAQGVLTGQGFALPVSGSGDVINMTVGAVTPNGATFATKVSNGPVRVAVANNPGMSNPTFFGPQSVNAQGVAKVSATGLQPNTRYWWRVEADGVLDTTLGQFVTHPPVGTAASFTLAFSGDAGLTPDVPGVGNVLAPARLSNHPVFDTIRERALNEGWLGFVHLGDMHYYDIGSGVHVSGHSITTYRRAIDDVLAQPRQHRLYREVPWAWTWDDHDWGPDDSDRTHPGGPNAQQSYREKIPHYPLPHANAIYQSWQIGRVLFIMSDTRSHRDPNDDPDVAGKTQLGTAQKQWMRNLLENSGAGFLVWILSGQWMGTSNESYNVQFTHEQEELATMFKDLGWQNKMCVVSADIHELGIETGTRSAGALPLFHFASLDARPGAAGEPHHRYDTGASSPGRNRYGTLSFTDTGTRVIVTGTGYIGDDVWKTYTLSSIPDQALTIPGTTRSLTGPHDAPVEAYILTEFQTDPEPEGVQIPVLGGSVTFDATAQVFATLSLETEGYDGKQSLFPRRASDLLSPYGNEIFVRRGIDFGDEIRWFPLGIFRINDVEQADNSGNTLRITAQDRMSSIIDSELIKPTQFHHNWHIGSVVRNLVRNVYPDAVITFDDDSKHQLTGRPMIVEQSRFDALQNIAFSLGKIIFWDDIGALRIQSAPDPDDLVWTIRAGRNGALVQANRSVSRETMKNGFVAKGEGATGNPVFGTAIDLGTNSPTRWGGKFGRIPGFFSSPLITSTQQAVEAARAKLRRHLGLPYSVNFGSVPNPSLRPWETVRIIHEDGTREKHLVMSNSIPLLSDQMSGSTKEQTRVLMGEIKDDPGALIGHQGEDL